MRRNSNIRIQGVPKHIHGQFRRALALAGAGSQSKWILTQIRQFVRQQQEKFGEDLFHVLTAEEKDLLDVIASGAAELPQIIEESMLPEKQVITMLTELKDRGFIEERPKGGKTDQARGAKIKLYFVVEK